MMKFIRYTFSVITTYEEWNSSNKTLYGLVKFFSELFFLILCSMYSFLHLSREGEYILVIGIAIIITIYSVLYGFLNLKYIERHFIKTRDDISKIQGWLIWFNSLSFAIATSGPFFYSLTSMFDGVYSVIGAYFLLIFLSGTIFFCIFNVLFSSLFKLFHKNSCE